MVWNPAFYLGTCLELNESAFLSDCFNSIGFLQKTNNAPKHNFRIASVISKMGFLFLEQEFSKLLLPVCVSISISCSASGFICQVTRTPSDFDVATWILTNLC